MVTSVTVAQEQEQSLKETHNEAISNGVHVEKAQKSSYIEQEKAKEAALSTKSNQMYEATDEAKAKWIKENAKAYRDQVTKDATFNPDLTPPGYKRPATNVSKDRPVYVDTGNSEQDRLNYRNAKNKWLKKNDPAAYQKMKASTNK
jgi:hypothetical protein